jgi:hypothetical protein
VSDCNAIPAEKDKSLNVNTDSNDLIRIPSTKPITAAMSVVVNIQPGTVSPAQKQAWGRFWQKIIIEVKKEIGE